MTKAEEVKKVADQVQEKYGRLDIAFNNAGIGVNVPSEDCSDEDWLRVVNVNLNAVFFCCREFGKIMLRQGKGSIINTASMSGVMSNTRQPQSAYNASKGAVIMLADRLAGGWTKRGVRVELNLPWLHRNGTDKVGHVPGTDWSAEDWLKFTPMGRVGEPREVAAAFPLPASDASSFFTGGDFFVDGGYTCW